MASEALCNENQPVFCFPGSSQSTCLPPLETSAVLTFFLSSSSIHVRLCPTVDCPSSPLFSLCMHTLEASAKTSLPQEGLLWPPVRLGPLLYASTAHCSFAFITHIIPTIICPNPSSLLEHKLCSCTEVYTWHTARFP